MAFVKKTWKDRVSEYINRRTIIHDDGTREIVSVERNEGTISQEGDAFSAENMNDLEKRVFEAFDGWSIKVVDSLPAESQREANTIYLCKN